MKALFLALICLFAAPSHSQEIRLFADQGEFKLASEKVRIEQTRLQIEELKMQLRNSAVNMQLLFSVGAICQASGTLLGEDLNADLSRELLKMSSADEVELVKSGLSSLRDNEPLKNLVGFCIRGAIQQSTNDIELTKTVLTVTLPAIATLENKDLRQSLIKFKVHSAILRLFPSLPRTNKKHGAFYYTSVAESLGKLIDGVSEGFRGKQRSNNATKVLEELSKLDK